MKKSSLRAFGIACFVIGALYTINDKFDLGISKLESNESTTKYEVKISQLEQKLAEANKQIYLLEENETKLAKEEKPEDTTETINDTTPPLEEKNNDETIKDIVNGTLYIYSGLTPYEVGQKLEDLGIVENAVEMELFLAKPEYSRSIQKGQYELNSSMSIEEIAKIITAK